MALSHPCIGHRLAVSLAQLSARPHWVHVHCAPACRPPLCRPKHGRQEKCVLSLQSRCRFACQVAGCVRNYYHTDLPLWLCGYGPWCYGTWPSLMGYKIENRLGYQLTTVVESIMCGGCFIALVKWLCRIWWPLVLWVMLLKVGNESSSVLQKDHLQLRSRAVHLCNQILSAARTLKILRVILAVLAEMGLASFGLLGFRF